MALIYDGIRVFSAADAADALAAKMNELQDQLILGLEGRTIVVPIQLAYHDPNEVSWRYTEVDVANPPHWSDPGNALGKILLLPIPYMPSDTLITEIVVIIAGNELLGDANAGAIELWAQPIDDTPTAAASVQDIGGATPWRQAGAVTLITSGAIAVTTVAESAYMIAFTGPTAVAARNPFVYGAYYKAQFHSGV